MKVTVSHRTNYSNSPVIILIENNGEKYQPDTIKLALTSTGDVYRVLSYNEQPVECEPFEIELTEKTVALLDNWRKYHNSRLNIDLYKLAEIQKYHLLLGDGSIRHNPIYLIDISLYYAASAALEQQDKATAYCKQLGIARAEITSLKQQVQILQAKLKVPVKMAEMNCNEKQALAYVLGGKNYQSQLTQLFDKKIIHPNGYTGIGKYCSKGSDKAAAIANILSLSHIKHITGNDAPKGGFSGNFIKIK